MFTIDPEKDSPEQIVGNVLSKMEDAYYQSFQERLKLMESNAQVI